MKKMKMAIVVMLALSMLLTGCKSMIGAAIEESIRRSEAREISIKDMFSEKDGFHFPGYSWGDEFGAFQQAADFPISEIAGYSEDGTFYDAADWHVNLDGMINDGATVATDMIECVQMVMFEYSGSKTPISKAEFQAFADNIGKYFTIQPTVKERDEETDTVTYHYVTYYWTYTLPDGKETSLQWASATVKGTTNPSAVTFSLSYLAPEEKKDEKK